MPPVVAAAGEETEEGEALSREIRCLGRKPSLAVVVVVEERWTTGLRQVGQTKTNSRETRLRPESDEKNEPKSIFPA